MYHSRPVGSGLIIKLINHHEKNQRPMVQAVVLRVNQGIVG